LPLTKQFASQILISASDQRRNKSKGLKDFNLKAKARIWPYLSYVSHIRSIADTRHVLNSHNVSIK